MNRRRYEHSHSTVFLLEIMLAILCFALVSAVCLRLLVYARQLSRRSGDVSFAVGQVSSAAALLEQAQSPAEALTLLQTQLPADETGQVYYDDQYALCPSAQAVYILRIDGDQQSLCTWQLAFYRTGESEPLYAVTLEVYYGA
jgi:hypothetical protein